MTTPFAVRLFGAAILATLLGACASTDPTPMAVPTDPTTSVEQADQRLAAVAKERAAIEARHAEREAFCYEKFFVNKCLDEAQERRRAALSAQRAIEIEAERFKRRVKVDERDRAIVQAEAEYKAEEAALAAQPPAPPRATPALPPPRKGSAEARQKQRGREEAGQERLSEAERAANLKEFEERKRKSEQRQAEVAKRTAERDAKAARRAAEEAKAKAEAASAVGK